LGKLMADAGAHLSPDVERLLHNLQLHKVELEMQNDELRRTQANLKASRERYFKLYDLAPIGYFTLDDEGLVVSANLCAARFLGRGPDVLVGRPLTAFICPADQDIYFLHRRQLVATGVPQACDLRLLHQDGSSQWVRLEASADHAEDDAPICRATVSDISERKRVETALAASETLHRMLFAQSRDALMTLSPPDWRFSAGNTTTVGMFGARDEADFVSRTPACYSPERQLDGRLSAEKSVEMLAAAVREGSCASEWTYRRLTGEEFPASVVLKRMEIDGRMLVQATVRDETETKRLQARVGQSERLASMGLLAAGIAHEINNPLAYVLHNVETLAQDLPKIGKQPEILESMLEELTECAREALDGIGRIKQISSTLGAFARVESSERAPVDLTRAIDCAITMAFNQIKYRAGLTRNFLRVPAVWASEGKLSQVFLNLLINAAHAIAEGNVEHNSITVRTWAEGDDVFAEVADTGKGISPATLTRIFEPFFTTKAATAGSGLGLSICKNILLEFGGDIRVESELGKGTRFIVRLPADKDASHPLLEMPSSEAPQPASVHGRILVVDDEPGIRRTLARLLRQQHSVVSAASGAEARAIMEADQNFDLILCDVMMPDMIGTVLHEWVIAHFPMLAKRMVFMSGGIFTPQVAAYLDQAGNLRIDKPFNAATLMRIVAKRIASTRARP
jgi:PAS domain S-box-containing protein